MARKSIKWFCCILSGKVIALIVLTIGVGSWFYTGERSVSFIMPKLNAVLAERAQLQLAARKAYAQWGGFSHPMSVHLDSVSLRDSEGGLVAYFPQADISLDLWSAISGTIRVETIELRKPLLTITKEQDDQFYLGFGNGEGDTNNERMPLASYLKRDNNGSHAPMNVEALPTILIQGAQLIYRPLATGQALAMDQVDIALSHGEDDVPTIAISSKLVGRDAGTNTDTVSALADYTGDGWHIDSTMENVSLAYVCVIIDCPEVTPLSTRVSANVDLHVNEQGLSGPVNVALSSQEILLDHAELFPIPVLVDSVNASLHYDHAAKETVIEEINVGFVGARVHAKGRYAHVNERPDIQLDATLSALPFDALDRYWPMGVGGDARDWVTNNLNVGKVTEGTISVSIDQDDWAQESLPPGILDAKLFAENVTVRYLDHMPEVRAVNAEVFFTGHSMDANIASGKTLSNSSLKKSVIRIPDFYDPNVRMQMELNLKGDARDIARIISSKHLDIAQAVNLDETKISGMAEGTIKLDFDAFSEGGDPDAPPSFDAVNYDITANVTSATQQGIANKYDLENIHGNLALNNNLVSFKGNGRMFGEDVSLWVKAPSGKPAQYGAKMMLPRNKYDRMGIPNFKHIGVGMTGLDVTVTEYANYSQTQLTADFTRNTIALDEIGLNKRKGESGTLQLRKKQFEDGRIELDNIDARLDTLLFKGAASLDAQNELTSLSISSFTHRRTRNIQGNYTTSPKALTLRGEQLDVHSLLNESDERNAKNQDGAVSPSDLLGMSVTVALDHLYLDDEEPLNDVRLSLECNAVHCSKGEWSAQTGLGEVGGGIRKVGGQRRFAFRATNTGEFLSAIDKTDAVRNGKLVIEGGYNDTSTDSPLQGRIIAENFTLKDAPVAGKILSLTSFTGLLDTLQGNGIRFDKFGSDFHFKNDMLTLDGGRLKGPSVGSSIQGRVDLGQDRIDLKGTLVPAYVLNTFVSKIPFVGELVAGGKDAGIVGVDFSVKGPLNDTSVVVNPLSVLTPGFTRNIFGIFEQPVNTESQSDGEDTPPSTGRGLQPSTQTQWPTRRGR